ncbi:alpha/beta hydrolase [Actinoplanes sp. DH11]|uniref:alpha/beta hydrolase n=1 Tax=Actinoplanes sp. DH11 TaxID=2857011 RepID=UPI001E3B7C0A|nr:alpha/beta hydrolase [Actinoplanes sp. DH11]
MNRMWIVAALLLATPALWLFGPTQAVAPVPPRVAGWFGPDPATATTGQVAAYFAALPRPATDDLVRRYPAVVGNLDGVPAGLRYAANRDPAQPERQYLVADRHGDGRVVEVLGDLGTARRVTILIPGVDTNRANFDTGLGGVVRRAPAWQARRLHAEISALRPGAPVAVIAWLGYDTPEGVRRDALREDRAATGALALRRFVAGLLQDRPQLEITLVGHSYGSIVAAHAAAELPAQVTDIVAIGSPGMGVPDRAALRTGARVWAGSAPDDWTRRLPGVRLLGVGHGRLPIDPAFGALRLPCADVAGHDGYFLRGTSSLRAMAHLSLPSTPPAASTSAASGTATDPAASGTATDPADSGTATDPAVAGLASGPGSVL